MRAYKALGSFPTAHGPVLVRKVFARKQGSWILVLEGAHNGLRQLLPDWMPRGPSTRTQISPPKPLKRIGEILDFFQKMTPIWYQRLAGKPVPTPAAMGAPTYRTLAEVQRVVEREVATSLRAGSLTTFRHQWNAVLRVLDPGLPLVELTRERIQDAVGVLRERYAPTTVKCLMAALGKLLNRAVEDGVIVRNPAELVRVPKAVAKPKRVLTRAQRDAVLAEAEKRGERAHLLMSLLLLAGLRRREVLALTWTDVDLEHRVLMVQNSESFTTKSGEGRVIPLCNELFAALSRHHRSAGFVVAPEKVYGSRYRYAFSKLLASIANAAGVPWLHAHLARHVFATLYLEGGGNIHRLAGYLGHSSAEISAIYAHHLPGGDDIEALGPAASIPA